MGTDHKAEKKRKRASEKPDRPSKKPALAPGAPAVKVRFVQNPNGAVPVIASTPGISSIPSSIPLTAYSTPRQNRPKHNAATNTTLSTSELLLQSSAHPRIDFVAKEGEDELDTLWNHYVAVYDPDAGRLELVEARKMTMRGCVRRVARKPINDEEGDEDVATKSNWAQRTALTEAFGTKQSRKAIQSIAENALLSNAPAGSGPTAVESALLSSIPKEDASTPGSPQKTAQAEIQAAKPLPQPNLSATHPAQVYAIDTLVPNGIATLRTMPVQGWQAAIRAGEPVLSSSRFVAHRVDHVVRSGDLTQLQLLRYINILIELSRSLKPSRGGAGGASAAVAAGSKKLPPREDLRRILSSSSSSSSAAAQSSSTANKPTLLPDSFLDALRRKFVPQRTFLSKTDITFLHTTICALSLHIPPEAGFAPNELATDPADLRDDLSLEYQTIQQYFRELGCRVEKPRESEFAKWGVRSKVEAGARRIARLRVPVEFPKVSRGARR
ncbi:DNA-directed RNA polymerase I subunit RPA49 [Blastomyces parvus]|uniref:DNA-directed RNA polymerase I subunit RPA49 n=1 Tax=Blastomyces parvus TaxID=2060905 RepID=A0A2B7XB92_9EURO|nr:DNA-directed RNA polymerase I subunit RPA49 [Blastomyces parvus]